MLIFIWQLLSITLPGKTVVVLLMGEETGMEAATVIQPAAAALGPGLVRRRRWRRHLATAKVLVKGLHDVTVLQRTRHPGQGMTALNTAITLTTRVTRQVFTFEFFAKTGVLFSHKFLSAFAKKIDEIFFKLHLLKAFIKILMAIFYPKTKTFVSTLTARKEINNSRKANTKPSMFF